MVESRLPVLDGHGPFLGNIVDRQVNHFHRRLISGESAMVFEDFSEGHVHRLNRVGGVDGFANFVWEGKEGNDATPMGHPGLEVG